MEGLKSSFHNSSKWLPWKREINIFGIYFASKLSAVWQSVRTTISTSVSIIWSCKATENWQAYTSLSQILKGTILVSPTYWLMKYGKQAALVSVANTKNKMACVHISSPLRLDANNMGSLPT